MKHIIVPIILLPFACLSCSKLPAEADQDQSAQTEEQATEQIITQNTPFVPGVAVVKFSDELLSRIESDLAAGMVVTKSAGLNSALDELGIVSMTRLFPHAGEFEPRTRAEGLHRWYEVHYDPNVPATRAELNLASVEGVEAYENRRRIAPAVSFNDPRFPEQWHYVNRGSDSGTGYKKGMDINVQPVWNEYTTGSSKVIVAVVDGGIDYNHADLAGRVIPGGANGSRNFVDNSYIISPNRHGTHVAGTIGAINNNSIGVAGVAGGDAAAKVDGVTLLSCQVFATVTDSDGKEVDRSGNTAGGVKWGADHGAVISQNSWGYVADTNGDGVLSPEEREDFLKANIDGSLRAAVDYFIKYAGCDNSGDQLPNSPMKGGIVIFAAGNDGLEAGPPSNYEPIVAVGAMDGQGYRCSFSNFGDFVDICAPGYAILSTMPNNNYGFLDGTSMACPHVSGVAALVVSYHGGQGFTADMLKERLLKGANADVMPKNAKIGPLVDALGAITYGSTDTPNPVTSYTVTPKSNNLVFDWTVTGVKKGRQKAYGYLLLASRDRALLQGANLKALPDGVKSLSIQTPESSKLGDAITGRISDLEFATDYYVAIAAYDYSRNFSALSEIKQVRTLQNNPPTVTSSASGTVQVHAHETITVNFLYSDPDGHALSLDFTPGSDAATAGESIKEGEYPVIISGRGAPVGTYTATLKATDTYGASSSAAITYQILPNHAPVKSKDFENYLLYIVGEKFSVQAEDYFSDPDGEALLYDVSISDQNVIHVNQSGNELFFTTLGFGLTDVTISGVDALGESVSSSFKVLVRDAQSNVDAYPNPVTDYLNIRTGEKEESTRIRLVSSTGAVVYDETATFSAFTPQRISVASFAPGRHTLSVTYGGNTYNQTIIKK